MLKNLQDKLKSDINDIKKELKDSKEIEKKCYELKVKKNIILKNAFKIRRDKIKSLIDWKIFQKCKI